jgi:hypothetical protein
MVHLTLLSILWTSGAMWSYYLWSWRVVVAVELRGQCLHLRSPIVSRTDTLDNLAAVVPGWKRPWYRRNGNWYILRRTEGNHLYLWGGKGVYEFLTALGGQRPELQIDEACRSKRFEKSIGKTGFQRLPT